jgi:hypothetical protein
VHRPVPEHFEPIVNAGSRRQRFFQQTAALPARAAPAGAQPGQSHFRLLVVLETHFFDQLQLRLQPVNVLFFAVQDVCKQLA